MLIVIGITAMLVTAAVQAHLAIRRAQERATRGLHRDRTVDVFLDRFERELVGTVLVAKQDDIDRLSHPWVFVAEDRFNTEADADGIRFITRSPARAAPTSEASGLKMVTYVTEEAPDRGMELLRQEEALPDSLQKEPVVQEGLLAMHGVASFRLRFLEEESESWRDDWDSTDIALLDQLPAAVEVAVRLLQTDESGRKRPGSEHTRTISLPVRPVQFGTEGDGFGAYGDGDGEDGEDGDDNEDDSNCLRVQDCTTTSPDHPMLQGFIAEWPRCYDRLRHSGIASAVQLAGGSWDRSKCPN
jgi:hypothetical protein